VRQGITDLFPSDVASVNKKKDEFWHSLFVYATSCCCNASNLRMTKLKVQASVFKQTTIAISFFSNVPLKTM